MVPQLLVEDRIQIVLPILVLHRLARGQVVLVNLVVVIVAGILERKCSLMLGYVSPTLEIRGRPYYGFTTSRLCALSKGAKFFMQL